MIICHFANIKKVLFVVLFVFSGEHINHLDMSSTDGLDSFNNLVGGA